MQIRQTVAFSGSQYIIIVLKKSIVAAHTICITESNSTTLLATICGRIRLEQQQHIHHHSVCRAPYLARRSFYTPIVLLLLLLSSSTATDVAVVVVDVFINFIILILQFTKLVDGSHNPSPVCVQRRQYGQEPLMLAHYSWH